MTDEEKRGYERTEGNMCAYYSRLPTKRGTFYTIRFGKVRDFRIKDLYGKRKKRRNFNEINK